jgi:hypothetical protein
MAEILSLSKARKAKAKAEKEASAEANRIKFGRTKAERQLTDAKKSLSDRHIDSHKRDD